MYLPFLTARSDAISPTIVGLISDTTGNIVFGVILVPVAVLLSGLTFAFGWRCLSEIVAVDEDVVLTPRQIEFEGDTLSSGSSRDDDVDLDHAQLLLEESSSMSY